MTLPQSNGCTWQDVGQTGRVPAPHIKLESRLGGRKTFAALFQRLGPSLPSQVRRQLRLVFLLNVVVCYAAGPGPEPAAGGQLPDAATLAPTGRGASTSLATSSTTQQLTFDAGGTSPRSPLGCVGVGWQKDASLIPRPLTSPPSCR